MVAGAAEVRSQLAAWGAALELEVAVASDARTGFGSWKALRPSVVMIAGIGAASASLRLARRIRKTERLRGFARCALFSASGYHDEAQYRACRDAGFDGVLTVPLRQGSFDARIVALGLSGMGASAQSRAAREQAEALFRQELAEDIGRLRAAIVARSPEDIARWAHRIKGASLMFGRQGVGDLAGLLEGEIAGHPPEAPAELARLMAQLETLAQDDFGPSPESPPAPPPDGSEDGA